MTTAKRDGHILVTVEHGEGVQRVPGWRVAVTRARPAITDSHIGGVFMVGSAEDRPRHDDAANVMDT